MWMVIICYTAITRCLPAMSGCHSSDDVTVDDSAIRSSGGETLPMPSKLTPSQRVASSAANVIFNSRSEPTNFYNHSSTNAGEERPASSAGTSPVCSQHLPACSTETTTPMDDGDDNAKGALSVSCFCDEVDSNIHPSMDNASSCTIEVADVQSSTASRWCLSFSYLLAIFIIVSTFQPIRILALPMYSGCESMVEHRQWLASPSRTTASTIGLAPIMENR